MKEVVSNLWAVLKMIVILTILTIVVTMMGLVQYIENNYDKVIIFGFTLLGFYFLKKGVDYIFWKLQQPKVVVDKPSEDTEVSYIKGLINEIKKKGKLTPQDKDKLDLLNIKLKQLVNV
jgi:hypothetical protein